ncbi:hypothetical protein LCGC14_1108620 [marine sediment metagenome]|uniref:Uncharacterized protein n=1 Tax=marine sediment metagenome TaxID=412755 RepID=A0A0F9PQL0_9ZZZZ
MKIKAFIRRKFQNLFIPRDEALRTEFAQLKKALQLILGENMEVGVDWHSQKSHGNTVVFILSHQKGQDIVKRLDLHTASIHDIKEMAQYLQNAYAIKAEFYFDGPPGFMEAMKEKFRD